MAKLKIVHYINQFFAQIGGEEQADHPAELFEGAKGPGLAFMQAFGDEAEIVSTIVCGDGYFNENIDSTLELVLGWIEEVRPDLVIAGPAFNAGRYGVACGAVAAAVQERLGIPAISGMYVENPGVDMYKDKVVIASTKNSAAGMRDAVKVMAPLALKLARGEALGASCEDGYLPQGVRVNFFESQRGSKRAVDMLLAKLAGKPFTTEYPMPAFGRVDPQPAVADLSRATIALVTSGGIVPHGNPDSIESSNASRYGEYDIAGIDDLTSEAFETAHGGYDPTYANQDADRVLPVDVMRELEREGAIGKLYDKFYSTVGNGTAVASAKAFAEEIGATLKANGVDAVLLTST